jgi:cytochrome b561
MSTASTVRSTHLKGSFAEELPMQFTNDTSRYGWVSQWLHWTTAALVIVLLVMGNAFEIETDEPGSALFFWHASLGVLVFILAAARIGWLLFSRPPALSGSTSRLFRVLARSTHIALYALLFALPVSGWLAASSEGASVPFFGIAAVPAWQGATRARAPSRPATTARESMPSAMAAGNMQQAAAESQQRGGGFKELHEVLGNVLLVLASLHVLAALKHHFLNHDDVLRRMLPRSRPRRTVTVGP